MMRRRKFMELLGSAAATWPLAARAQPYPMPVIGYLNSASAAAFAHLMPAFHKGLGEAGYVEGQNVAIEYRWAEGHNDLLASMAADLVRRQVAVIVTPISTAAALAAKAATSTIPIVFATGTDPVKSGLATSFNRPGSNATGVSDFGVGLAAKRLGLLHELLPGAASFAALVNPDNPFISDPFVAEVQAAAAVMGREIEVVMARTSGDIDTAFATFVDNRVDAFLISPEALFVARRAQLLTLAA